MAKVKKPLIKSKEIGPLNYMERGDQKDGFTHNLRITRARPKEKKKK